MTEEFREITDDGLNHIKSEEGTILFSYDDNVFPTVPAEDGVPIRGTLTIGTGHTGPDVFIGQRITEKKADELLDKDLDIVEQFIQNNVKVPINDNQHAVLCSFAFNAGIGGLDGSTLLRKLNAGDYEGAGKELLKWNKTTVRVGGKKKKVVSKGLTARRARELALWNAPAGTTITLNEQDVAEPRSTEIADPPVSRGLGWLANIFNMFKRKVDPITGQKVKVQPINPIKSKTNWSVLITILSTLLAWKGIDVPQDVQQNLVVIIPMIGAVVTWIINTFFRSQ